MGMSASQARYVMLAAKKSDVEFEGQQINQQRTNLATETSGYTTQLLTLTVPTPPSSTEFTKTNYSFDYKANTATINGNIVANDDGTYRIAFTYEAIEDKPRVETARLYRDGVGAGAPLSYNGKALTLIQAPPANADEDLVNEYNADYSRLEQIYPGQITGPNQNINGQYYKYESPDGETYYISAAEVAAYEAANAFPTSYEDSQSSDYVGPNWHFVEEQANVDYPGLWPNADIEWTDTGRAYSITYQGNEYLLNVTTETDEAAYEDAMNEYKYQKDLYSQEMDQINAKIEIIEQQDKKLEIKLQNLDTQQEALSTEMDSVKKVIDKNIEASFKAFA